MRLTLTAYQHRSTRAYLEQVLAECGMCVVKAARMSGRNRTDFYKLMKRHDIKPARLKGRGNAAWRALSSCGSERMRA